MSDVVQARLDAAARSHLSRLVRQLGLTPSEVVREALRQMALSNPEPERPRIIGLGKFSSGVPDLGTNKKHLDGFGQ